MFTKKKEKKIVEPTPVQKLQPLFSPQAANTTFHQPQAVKSDEPEQYTTFHQPMSVEQHQDHVFKASLPPPPTEDTISIEQTDMGLCVNQTYQIQPTVVHAPVDKSVLSNLFNFKTKVTWKSSSTAVATVDSDGVVTGVGNGKAIVTGTLDNGNMASVLFTVTTLLESLSFQMSPIICHRYQTLTLTPVFVPSTATDQNVTWASSDPSIATISESGVMTGISPGKIVITLTGSNNKMALAEAVVITPIRLEPDVIDLTIDQTQLIYAVTEATIQSWSSSAPHIATIENGLLTPVSGGVVTITATTTENVSATAMVTIGIPVHHISITPDKLALAVSETYQVSPPVIEPANATNKKVVWSSSYPSVATVDDNGLITAVSNGTTTIKAAVGRNVSSMMLNVADPSLLNSIWFNVPTVHVMVNDTYQLTPVIQPINATLTWTSSDPATVSVSDTGLATVLTNGAAVNITVKGVNGVCATATIIPSMIAESITIPSSLSIRVYERKRLTIVVLPDNAHHHRKEISWSSSNTDVAEVNRIGMVIAKSVGTCVVTASVNGLTTECQVTINPITLTSISLHPSYDIGTGHQQSLDITFTPDNASNRGITCVSSEPSIATFENNKLVGVSAGSCVITVTTHDGSFTATGNVHVFDSTPHVMAYASHCRFLLANSRF
jgi:uncharacterized protein YjdB